MQDYDDYPQDSPNPFRQRGFGGWLNRLLLALAHLVHFVVNPFRALGRLLGRVGATLAYTVENRLGRFGAWWANLWWRLAGWLRLDVVRRRVNRLQDTAVRSVDDLTMTVRERTTQASWVRRIGESLGAMLGGIHDRWMRFMEWAEQTWLTRALTAPLRWIVQISYSVVDFMLGWLWTRRYRHLLFGIPAILLVMPLAYCAVRLPFYTPAAKVRHYRRAVSDALVAEDYESAELYFRKLAQLGDVHEQIVLRSALLADDQGDVAEAYRQMLQIAPVAEAGIAQAHLWIAQRITAGQIEVDNPRAAELVESHVNHALSQGANDPVLNVWLAQVYLQARQYDKCLNLLDQTSMNDVPWPTRVVAADMYAALGRRDRARLIATEAREYFQQRRDNGTALVADEYVRWAIAAQLSGASGDAVDVLQQGLEALPDEPRLREELGRVGVAHFDSYRGNTPESWDERYAILQRLLKFLPDSEPLLRRMAELTLLPSVSDRATDTLATQQTAAPLPATVEKTLGDAAVVKQDIAAARDHYRAALQQDPDAHAALNNLAFLLANYEPHDLQQALQLVNDAVRLQPDNPHYLETRGQIYVRLERWQEAVADLRIAINGLPEKREIHEALAKAYLQLGDEATAGIHAAQAAR